MFTWPSFAQTSDQPLKFEEIPIGGTLDEFVGKLEKTGFSMKDKKDKAAFFKGNFACYRKCDITVLSSKTNDWVKQVGVSLPVAKKWEVLLNNYSVLKNTLKNIYGDPSDYTEQFISNDQPTDDETKMDLVKNNGCNYRSVFTAQDGDITLTITRNCNVLLMFTSNYY